MNAQKFRNFVITEFVKSGIHCTLLLNADAPGLLLPPERIQMYPKPGLNSTDDSFYLLSIIRVYYDRLIDNPDQKWFMNEIKKIFIRHFGEDFDKVFGHLDQGGKGSIDENDIRWET